MAKRMREKSAKRLENRDTRPTATARFVRMGAPKAKRLLDIIKNKSAVEACAILDITLLISTLNNKFARLFFSVSSFLTKSRFTPRSKWRFSTNW